MLTLKYPKREIPITMFLVIQPTSKKPKAQKSVLSFFKRTTATNIWDKNREKSNVTNEMCSSR